MSPLRRQQDERPGQPASARPVSRKSPASADAAPHGLRSAIARRWHRRNSPYGSLKARYEAALQLPSAAALRAALETLLPELEAASGAYQDARLGELYQRACGFYGSVWGEPLSLDDAGREDAETVLKGWDSFLTGSGGS